MSIRSVRVFSLALAGFAVAACGDSVSPDRQPVSLDEALTAASSSQSYMASALEYGGAGIGTLPQARDHSNCSYASATKSFVCAPVTINGITINRTFQLLDASNNPQSEFSSSTTAAVRKVTDVSGTITRTQGTTTHTVTFVAHDDVTLSGLLTGVHTLNSTGNSNAQVTGGLVPASVVSNHKVTDLVLPKRGGDTHYPQSGTIEGNMTTTVAGTSFPSSVKMLFDGSPIMQLQLTFGNVSRSCTVDLSKHQAQPVCSA